MGKFFGVQDRRRTRRMQPTRRRRGHWGQGPELCFAHVIYTKALEVGRGKLGCRASWTTLALRSQSNMRLVWSAPSSLPSRLWCTTPTTSTSLRSEVRSKGPARTSDPEPKARGKAKTKGKANTQHKVKGKSNTKGRPTGKAETKAKEETTTSFTSR